MNYRHAFHAGNFADVVKHIVLTRVLGYLHEKPSAFRLIDTHAGAGRYDLTGDEARRSGEWRHGIAKLFEAKLDATAAGLIKPYLDIVRSYNADGDLTVYPGSPLIARALLRPQDRMTACELEPGAHAELVAALRRDRQARVVKIDGWAALPAYVPPHERRGVVLIDPPFEQADEFDRLASGFKSAFAKWPTGIFMLWYPLKDARAAGQLGQRVADVLVSGQVSANASARKALAERYLAIEFQTGSTVRTDGLTAAGLIVVNPPWTLEREMAAVAPALVTALGTEGRGRFRIGAYNP
ncbi:23S rRNA (adenine(2030)-N(6))-methyltransferase RlmJ [Bradyrhizobium sp. LHD-71]|uniref:23S rRNA (adenine(2030)-N(6))-methyltransferase RlmJ n=1 Tax=Bradyrhizobium sp. LHD-71 TaxID=3072141 RepID=UPI00280E7F66|nr:23S rRNA (adenine(2030)-N(6))-methyltransferase RlmJ [Bradyrhizobium sp. LHD-71]MDQ8729010.1 23S rRNA (adenine(2030)-N(6))-methyltransferase RlmJ [Bradyrhizobium sp. LHD-71]